MEVTAEAHSSRPISSGHPTPWNVRRPAQPASRWALFAVLPATLQAARKPLTLRVSDTSVTPDQRSRLSSARPTGQRVPISLVGPSTSQQPREIPANDGESGHPRFPGARKWVVLPLLVISGLATGPRQGWATGFDSFQGAANTSVLAGRFVCLNSAFSQQISTFYGPSVQAMDTQLKALPTLLSSLEAFCLVELRVF